MRITDLPQALRPRERLLAHGAATLDDTELLAILLRTGSGGQSAIELGQQLLARFGSMPALLRAEPAALERIRGLGEAKRATLLAVQVMLDRVHEADLRTDPVLESREAAARYLRLRLDGMTSECFIGLFIDMQGRLIATEELATGTLDRVNVYPREVVRLALKHNAAAMIFAHNHPGGRALPSALDKSVTEKLKQAMACVEVKVLDHLIIAGGDIWSFHDHGLC